MHNTEKKDTGWGIMKRRPSSRIELLAPAGDLHRCKTAIRFGADAVYIGGQSYSLRSRASNFTNEDIAEACAFAKTYGARIHVTVNIIPHDEDFEGLISYLQFLQDVGVTAVICASAAIMRLVRTYAPKLEVHCSTQMSITNAEAAAFLKEALDIDRVVLARECTMEDVRKIAADCPVQTEAFIHGGMCVNYSGRCTLSNRMTLRDANRGGCAQSCRWAYHLYDGDTEISTDPLFTMGSKDLCAAEYTADLIRAGVSSLKIEGRMKSEFYVASIVSAYRHLIDDLYANDCVLSEDAFRRHRQEIMRAENRETFAGFYPHRADKESLIFHQTSNSDVNHDFLGVVRGYDPEAHTMTVECRNAFDRNEKLEVLAAGEENRVFIAEWIRNEEGELIERSSHPMDMVVLPAPFAVSEEDIIRRAYDH